MRVFDAAIVGAGPAGSALAILLARAGHSVLLLEAKSFPRDKVCGDFVSPKGLQSLKNLGCYDEIAAVGCTRLRSSVVYLNGKKLSEGFLPALHGYPEFGHAVPRQVLDEVLFRRAREVGATTLENCRVTGFHTTPSIACVEARVGGANQRFAARVIVGADGANSLVARRAGFDISDPRYVMGALRSYCTGLRLTQTILYFDEQFFPGFGWIFPVNDRMANVGVGMVKEPLVKHGLNLHDFYARLLGFVRQLAARANTQVEFGDSAGFPIRTYGGRRRNTFERGLLIGEAACLVDPISGEGIPLALESAELAFETLHRAFESHDYSTESLADYDARWKARWDPDLKLSDLIVTLIRNRYLVKLWIQSFRVMSLTAMQDSDYALRTGGILAGLIPNREGLSPDIIFKTLVHGPDFWRRALEIPSSATPSDLMRKGISLLEWNTTALRQAIDDQQWYSQWLREVGLKQFEVLRQFPTLLPSRTPFLAPSPLDEYSLGEYQPLVGIGQRVP